MKKIFIIYCNPKKESFSQAIAQSYFDGAQKFNNQIKITNVYDLEVEYFDFESGLSDELKEFQSNILWADEVVFIYPVWCSAIPAKLKNIIERTFQPGLFFEYHENGYPLPLLKNKTATIIQTCSAPTFILKYTGGDLSFKQMKDILNLTGIKVKKRFDFGMIDKSTPEKRRHWLEKINDYASKIQ